MAGEGCGRKLLAAACMLLTLQICKAGQCVFFPGLVCAFAACMKPARGLAIPTQLANRSARSVSSQARISSMKAPPVEIRCARMVLASGLSASQMLNVVRTVALRDTHYCLLPSQAIIHSSVSSLHFQDVRMKMSCSLTRNQTSSAVQTSTSTARCVGSCSRMPHQRPATCTGGKLSWKV